MATHLTRTAQVAVIGGSGLYAMDGLENVEELRITTPFGDPSDAITLGSLPRATAPVLQSPDDAITIAFLPRHGRGHVLSPSEIPARANIYALKSLGVSWVISVSAVGSLREDYAPLDLVIPDQLYDRTRVRPTSFFEGGLVAHISLAEPFCPHLSALLSDTLVTLPHLRSHRGGAYVCIEGPQFSTKAESRIYRSLGLDIIGMTALPEARLAREAELHYATIACVTDYDVWHESEETVTVEMVVANLTRNVANAQRAIRSVVSRLPLDSSATAPNCDCANALRNAIITDPQRITPELRERYALLLGKYTYG